MTSTDEGAGETARPLDGARTGFAVDEPGSRPSTTAHRLRLVLAPVLGLALLAGAFVLGRASVGDPEVIIAAPEPARRVVQDLPQPGISPTSTPTPSATLARPLIPAATYDLPAPVNITIPDLGIAQRLVELGVTPDLQLEVPTNGTDIGWWKTGPSPGEPGGAVIAAHVTWGGGKPAVFINLATLAIGAEIIIDRADGTKATYVVSRSELYAKDDFPNELIYRRDGPTQLYVITCAGDFLNGTYSENVVVFADLVGDTRVDPNA